MVDLVFDKESVTFSTPNEDFEKSAISFFNKGVNSTKKIPQLEKMVLKNLFWSGTPLLESVGENEPLVKKLRETIQICLKKATIPMNAYAKEYEKYLELANLDIEVYLE